MTLEEKLKLFKDKGFTYDPETGIVLSYTGKVTKAISGGYSYLTINIKYKKYTIKSSQFAWYMTYNEIPNVIDHIDRDKLNNKITNLRNITNQKNTFNTSAKGYFWHKTKKSYQAHIGINNKRIWLGNFKTEEEARQAYLDAKKIYHII